MLTASLTVPRHFLGLPQLWLPAQAYLSCSTEFLGGSQKESAIPPAAGQSVPKLPGSSGPHGVPSGGPAACVESWHLHSWVLWSWVCCRTCMSQFLVDIGVMIIPTSLCLEGHLRAWHMVNAGATSVCPEPGTPGPASHDQPVLCLLHSWAGRPAALFKWSAPPCASPQGPLDWSHPEQVLGSASFLPELPHPVPCPVHPICHPSPAWLGSLPPTPLLRLLLVLEFPP